jgi:hypothetical protein
MNEDIVNVGDNSLKRKTDILCMLSVCEQTTGCKYMEDAKDRVSDGRHVVKMASIADGEFCGKYNIRSILSYDSYIL